MNVKFSAKELKANKLSYSNFEVAYLYAIKNQNPDVWADFVSLIKYIDRHLEESQGDSQ